MSFLVRICHCSWSFTSFSNPICFPTPQFLAVFISISSECKFWQMINLKRTKKRYLNDHSHRYYNIKLSQAQYYEQSNTCVRHEYVVFFSTWRLSVVFSLKKMLFLGRKIDFLGRKKISVSLRNFCFFSSHFSKTCLDWTFSLSSPNLRPPANDLWIQ